MPIVIDEFEILVEPPDGEQQPARQPSAEQAMPLGPDEIVRVLRRHCDRMERVRAD